MASITFDRRRGVYSIQWNNGVKFTRNAVHQIPRWKAGGDRPARDPAEVTRALADYLDKEKAAKTGPGAGKAKQSIEGFLKSYRATYERMNAEGSADQLRKISDHFLAWCNANKVVHLEDVTPTACQSWMNDRAGETSRTTKKPISYRTLVNEKAMLAPAWEAAVKLFTIPYNPWKAVTIPARLEDPERGSWSPDQYAKLVEACRPWLRDIVQVGCHCGIRIGGLLRLLWTDVEWAADGDLGLGIIHIRKEIAKGRRGYSVPLHPVAHDVLARRRLTTDSPYLLTGEGGQPSHGETTWSAIKLACARAGLPDPDSPNHHMRRTFGRWAVFGQLTGRPVPVYIVSKWMGHSSIEMTERYLALPHDVSATWMGAGPATGDA